MGKRMRTARSPGPSLTTPTSKATFPSAFFFFPDQWHAIFFQKAFSNGPRSFRTFSSPTSRGIQMTLLDADNRPGSTEPEKMVRPALAVRPISPSAVTTDRGLIPRAKFFDATGQNELGAGKSWMQVQKGKLLAPSTPFELAFFCQLFIPPNSNPEPGPNKRRFVSGRRTSHLAVRQSTRGRASARDRINQAHPRILSSGSINPKSRKLRTFEKGKHRRPLMMPTTFRRRPLEVRDASSNAHPFDPKS